MRTPPVLMYHGFGTRTAEADPCSLFVDLDRFERQVRYLSRAFRPLASAEFLAGLDSRSWPPRALLVTMDDGFASTWEAATVLARHRVPGIVYIPSGRVGTTSAWSATTPDEPLLDAEQLRALPSLGVQVGVHGMDHVSMIGLTRDELVLHTRDAREALADMTGVLPQSFAYPYGEVDHASAAAVRDAGYRAGMSVMTGGRDRWRIRRRGVCRTDNLLTCAVKTSAVLPYVSRAVHAARSAHAVPGPRQPDRRLS